VSLTVARAVGHFDRYVMNLAAHEPLELRCDFDTLFFSQTVCSASARGSESRISTVALARVNPKPTLREHHSDRGPSCRTCRPLCHRLTCSDVRHLSYVAFRRSNFGYNWLGQTPNPSRVGMRSVYYYRYLYIRYFSFCCFST